MTTKQAVVIGTIIGLMSSVLIICTVVATGSTFGQRCAKIYEEGSAEWHNCVKELWEGGQ